MKRLISLTALLLFSIFVIAQDESAYEVKKEENKFIYSANTVKIFAGQRIHIEAANTTGKLEGLKLLDSTLTEILDPAKLVVYMLRQKSEKSICIDYAVLKKGDGKYQTVVIVNNPFSNPLSYKAKIYSAKNKCYVETSIYDVMPGICGMELWPYPINDFVLYDFTVKE